MSQPVQLLQKKFQILVIKLIVFVQWIFGTNDKPLLFKECGQVYYTRGAKIVGGENAKFGQNPWQVAIVKQQFLNQKISCGGALIKRRFIGKIYK